MSLSGPLGARPGILMPRNPRPPRCADFLDLRTGSSTKGANARIRPYQFWLVVLIFVVVLSVGTVPAPLYVLWQQRLGFGTGVLTLIFAVYPVIIVAALLLLSQLSDQIGRRPVLVASIVLSGAGVVVFLLANSVAALLVARCLTGLAAGLMAPTATAALTELEHKHRVRRASLVATTASVGGLGLGPLVAGFVAQFGSDPTRLAFWIYLAALVVVLLCVAAIPETVNRTHIDLRPHGLAVPSGAGVTFALVAGAAFCAYTLVGLFSSLVPSFLAGSLHQHNHAVAGAVAAGIFIVGVISQLVLRGITPRRAVNAGLLLLLVSLAVIELALWDGNLYVFLAGTITGGFASGLTFMGGIATVNLIAKPEHRAQIVATFFMSTYAAITIPAVAVGVASQSLGTKDTTLYFTIVIGALATLSLAAVQRHPTPGTKAGGQT